MTDSYVAPKRAPRQLDIIADTALSKMVENGPHLSTRAPVKNGHHSSTKNGPHLSTKTSTENGGYLSTKNGPHLSTKAPVDNAGSLSATGFKKFEARRKELGIPIAKLCAAAEIHPNTYKTMRREEAATRPGTMLKLRRALNRMATGEKGDSPRSLLEIVIRLLTADLARQVGADPAKVLETNFDAENSNDPEWLQACRLRRAAIYLMVEGVGIGKADAGHALGITRQAIHKAIVVIEMERDRDDGFDRIMRKMMIVLGGEK